MSLMTKEHYTLQTTRELSDREKKTRWIGQILRSTLHSVEEDASVCCLCVGNAEELPHVRNFIGRSARLFAFDIKRPNGYGYLSIQATSTSFFQIDVTAIDSILPLMEKAPDLIICRNPDIVFTDKNGNVTRRNEALINSLVDYAKKIDPGGQMLVTHYSAYEQGIISSALSSGGVSVLNEENTFTPEEYWQGRNAAKGIPDRFTTIIRR